MPLMESDHLDWSDQNYLTISSEPINLDESLPLYKYVFNDQFGKKFYISSSKPLSQQQLRE
jgi:hypothetical protein